MLVLIDPHSDDTIYQPLLYKIIKKRPFKKYNYLNDAMQINGKIAIHFTYKKSSIPSRFLSFLPNFLLKLIIKVEIYFWKRVNEIKVNEIKEVDVFKHEAFIFGKKKVDIIHELSNKFKNVYVHLSHYHGFDSFNDSSQKNIYFCADNDISDFDYFKNKFPWYESRKLFIVPFCVDDRFIDNQLDRASKCCITGTYHDIPREYVDFGIYNSKGNSTLHPLRFDLSTYESEKLEKRLTLFGDKDPLSKQKKYFNFNIVDFYNSYNYALVPGEGNGLIAIGSLEAISSGCTIFLTDWEAKELFNEGEYVKYDGTLNDFIEKLDLYLSNDIKIINPNIFNKFKKTEAIARFVNNFKI